MSDDLQRELQREIDQLPREVPPGRDLWPGIARRIDAPARAGGGALLPWAAGIAAIGLLTAGLGLLARPPRVASGHAPPAVARPARPAAGPPSIVDALDASIDPLRKRILADVASDPAGTARVASHVAGLDVSIRQLEELARRNPDDAGVVLALARLRRRELGLLLRAAR